MQLELTKAFYQNTNRVSHPPMFIYSNLILAKVLNLHPCYYLMDHAEITVLSPFI